MFNGSELSKLISIGLMDLHHQSLWFNKMLTLLRIFFPSLSYVYVLVFCVVYVVNLINCSYLHKYSTPPYQGVSVFWHKCEGFLHFERRIHVYRDHNGFMLIWVNLYFVHGVPYQQPYTVYYIAHKLCLAGNVVNKYLISTFD